MGDGRTGTVYTDTHTHTKKERERERGVGELKPAADRFLKVRVKEKAK